MRSGILVAQIFCIREAHHELLRLLNGQNSSEGNPQEGLQAFLSIDTLQVGKYTEARWDKARSEYEQEVIPLQQRVAVKMKENFRKYGLVDPCSVPCSRIFDSDELCRKCAHTISSICERSAKQHLQCWNCATSSSIL